MRKRFNIVFIIAMIFTWTENIVAQVPINKPKFEAKKKKASRTNPMRRSSMLYEVVTKLKPGEKYKVKKLIKENGNAIVGVDRPYYDERGFLVDGRKYGMIDKNGKEIVPLKFDGVCSCGIPDEYDTNVSLLCVEQKRKIGFINLQGEMVIPMNYDWSFELYNEVYKDDASIAVRKGEKCGLLNRDGSIRVPFVYDLMETNKKAWPFAEPRLIKVLKDKKWGYIDYTGKEVVPIIFDRIEAFKDGYAKAHKDGEIYKIDHKGLEPLGLNRLENGHGDVVDTQMTFRQMITRPLGVLPENSAMMGMTQVKKFISANYPNWEIDSGLRTVYTSKGYNMSYKGNTPHAGCSFYGSGSDGLNKFTYIFTMKNKKDAISFLQNLIEELALEGVNMKKEQNEYGQTASATLNKTRIEVRRTGKKIVFISVLYLL